MLQTTLDRVDRRETLRQRQAFARVRNAERAYGVQLRRVAQHVGDLVRGLLPEDSDGAETLLRVLERYAEILRPWARSVARRMLADVSRRDLTAWQTHARLLGTEIKRELLTTPVGAAAQQLMDDQVELITSLPLDAAQRVHQIVTGNLYTGQRAEEVAKQIMLTGHVVRSRANLIARTETSRAAITFAQARAENIGSEGYVWRTVHDIFVRPLHKKLEGSYHRWDDPPVSGERGERSHPGGVYNCRCWADPIIPDKYA